MTKKQLKKAYNEAAKDFLISRTQANVDTGIYNREIEQPTMFKLVQKNLKNKKLLDAACGPGIHLKEYVKRGAKGFGIDLTPNMIKLAKEYCKGAKFEVGTIEKLKFKDASFDIVTCSLALDHIKDLNKAIKQINRVLKKNGLFIFSIPHPITYMFRDSEKGEFIPTPSYFDDSTRYYKIVQKGKKIPGFPRMIDTYFKILIKNNFEIIDFIESGPKDSWDEKNPKVKILFKIPYFCFFKCRKK